MKAEFIADGVQIKEPNNYLELAIELAYDSEDNTETVSTNSFEFGVGGGGNDDMFSIIKKYRVDGLIGGVGVLEGLPFKINLNNELGKTINIFDGYVDLSTAKYYRESVIANIVELNSMGKFNDEANSFTYEFLYEQGFFDSSYFVPVPYCISKKQNAGELIMMIFSIWAIATELKTQALELQKLASSAANPFETISAVINITLQIIFIIALFVALVNLLIDLYNYLVQPVKYHNGMYAKDLVEIGLQKLGLKLSSSILQTSIFSKLLILPEKYNIPETKTGLLRTVIGTIKPNRNERTGYYKGTLAELLADLKAMFNAKIRLHNGTLYFEKQDFNITQSQYQLPPLDEYNFTYNVDELYSNIRVSFAHDFDDRNTVQEWRGNNYQVIHYPISINNPQMGLVKNLKDISIPFARGSRKVSLNLMEMLLDNFFDAVGFFIDIIIKVLNFIISVINFLIKALNRIIKWLRTVGIKINFKIKTINKIQSPNLQNLIDSRINMLQMESDYITVKKAILVDNNSNPRNNILLPENESLINALFLYENYYYFHNFVTTKGWNNQHVIKEFNDIYFTFSDYEKVRTNSIIKDSDGNDCELITLKYNPVQETASGTYKKKEIWTNNLQIKYIYPND
jgi:hypothetical protein